MRQKIRSRHGVWGKKTRESQNRKKEKVVVGKTPPVCRVHMKAEFVLKKMLV